MNINIVYSDKLDACHKAMTVCNEDGSYTIIVNYNLPEERMIHEVIHELSHIEYGHFSAEEHATLLEQLLHSGGCEVSVGKYNFFYSFA